MPTHTRRKQRLFNDNPRGKPRLRTLGYGTEKKAVNSVRALKKMPPAYQRQAATTMYYRAKYHAKQTPGMRAAMRVYGSFLKTLRSKHKGGAQPVPPSILDYISNVVFINLDSRKDRREQIEAELKPVFPPERIHRIAAIKDEENGYRGSIKSHILAVELAKKNGWPNVLVLEDDAV